MRGMLNQYSSYLRFMIGYIVKFIWYLHQIHALEFTWNVIVLILDISVRALSATIFQLVIIVLFLGSILFTRMCLTVHRKLNVLKSIK